MNFSQYLISNGVSAETVFLLLALPFLVFIISFVQYVIGIKIYSIYEPLILTYSFYLINTNFKNGLLVGIPVIIIIWLAGELMKRIFSKAKMHNISKISLKLIFASIVILGLLSIASYYDLMLFTKISPISTILIITLLESVTLFDLKIGSLKTNILNASTLIVTIFLYFLLANTLIKDTLINYPYLICLPIIGEILVGRFKGLQASEIIRFKGLFRND